MIARTNDLVKRVKFEFTSSVWLYPSVQAAWHFISVPEQMSVSIKSAFGASAKGWGSIPVRATVGKTSWDTSVFPDKKRKAYILPLKAAVRKAEDVGRGDQIKVSLKIVLNKQETKSATVQTGTMKVRR